MHAAGLAQRRAIPVPEPDLTPKQMIARAAALRAELRAQQDEADERGTYSAAMHEKFVAAGTVCRSSWSR